MEFFATPKKSCLTLVPCTDPLQCAKCSVCTSSVFGTHKELRSVALVSGSNKINTKNEGKKFGSYARIYAKRNSAVFSKTCQCKLENKNVYTSPTPTPPTPTPPTPTPPTLSISPTLTILVYNTNQGPTIDWYGVIFTLNTNLPNFSYTADITSTPIILLSPFSSELFRGPLIERNTLPFSDNLIGVTIGNIVTSISISAFEGCTNLNSVTFTPTSILESIGNNAFADCTSLTSVVIPNSVTSIGGSAFANCTSLVSVTIPNSVSMGKNVFPSTALITIINPNSGSSSGNIVLPNNGYVVAPITNPNSGPSSGNNLLQNNGSTPVTNPNSGPSSGNGLTPVPIPNSGSSSGNGLTPVPIPNSDSSSVSK
jgi:hypothetical protein